MKILSFNYTKADGKVSQRVVLELSEPSKFYQGIDLSELDEEQQALFANAVNEVYDDFRAKLASLEKEFDVTNKFRQFDPTKMTNLEKDWV